MVKALATAAALAILATTSVSAKTVVLEDDFSGYGTSTELKARTEFFGGQWMVSSGTVDYIAEHGNFGYLCRGEGGCIDLDGSTKNAGLFSSQVFASGRYTLDLGLYGSKRNTLETLTIGLGDWRINFPNTQPDANVSGSWTFDTTGGSLFFQNAGGDNVGMILTSVRLTSVPLPSGILLGLTGIGALALSSARRKRAAPPKSA